MAKHAGPMTQMSRYERNNETRMLAMGYGKQYDVYSVRRGTTGFPVMQTVDLAEAIRVASMPGYDYCETNKGWSPMPSEWE